MYKISWLLQCLFIVSPSISSIAIVAPAQQPQILQYRSLYIKGKIVAFPFAEGYDTHPHFPTVQIPVYIK